MTIHYLVYESDNTFQGNGGVSRLELSDIQVAKETAGRRVVEVTAEEWTTAMAPYRRIDPKAADRLSGTNKLKALGLTDAEIEAIRS